MLTPWFITGFCEGEAAFTYSRHGDRLNLYFAIKLNEEDKDLILQIQEFFGVGTIYDVKATPPRKYSGLTNPAVYYRVTRVSELEKVVEHFDNFPLFGKKLKSYKIWRQMFEVKQKFRQPDKMKLAELALSLSKLSNKNTKLRNRQQ
ncbi:MAG: LAGLIDADG family homing endonuclease [Candidatus Omnitrophica bacterium]|nr:LAGLIDADG family homing endonuclease [Candidatus Omnitrophota bacterium]